MAITLESPQPQELLVTVTGDLSIYEIGALHQQAVRALENARTVRFDLGAVEQCDSAGLQWLIMLQHWACRSGVTLSMEPLSSALRELVELFQAHHLLGLATQNTAGRRPNHVE